MLTVAALLAQAKTAQGIPSNYRLARVLEVPEGTVQRWNTGKSIPDDEKAVQLADLAGLDAAEVVAALHAQRAATGPMAAVWRQIAERAHGGAHAAALAFVALILSLFVGGGPDAGAMAKAVDTGAQAQQSLTTAARLYIMSTAKNAILAVLRTLRHFVDSCRICSALTTAF